ncbi:MAG: DNA recombination protein RmuC [Myxococcota bacterium]
MSEAWLVATGVGLMAAVAFFYALRSRVGSPRLERRIESLEKGVERSEQRLREELSRGRDEARTSSRELREEVGSSVKRLGDTVSSSFGELLNNQKHHLDTFSGQIETFSKQLFILTEMNEKRLSELRGVVDERLRELQAESGKKLDEMRRTVDEQLQGTLEKRLGEAFKQVSERLEAVHQGLGDMQKLAAGVGDLKKVLTNVKTRGTWGEVQLGALLDQILTPDQYAKNVATRPDTQERVEFALKLPGPDDDPATLVWLPIDAKFPQEDYQRLVSAEESSDSNGIEEATRALENRIKGSARDISEKYLNPPETTDFAIMFLPTEGLYAEVLRRPGLAETLQREFRVVVAGPTTLAALLNSLQMGFRTLAIERRSSEVWKLLGAIKNQFGQFSGILERVQSKLQQASTTIDDAARRSRTIERRLKKVEELPTGEARQLLPDLETASSPASNDPDGGA